MELALKDMRDSVLAALLASSEHASRYIAEIYAGRRIQKPEGRELVSTLMTVLLNLNAAIDALTEYEEEV